MKRLIIVGSLLAAAVGFFYATSSNQPCKAEGGSLDCIHCETNCCDSSGCIECP